MLITLKLPQNFRLPKDSNASHKYTAPQVPAASAKSVRPRASAQPQAGPQIKGEIGIIRSNNARKSPASREFSASPMEFGHAHKIRAANPSASESTSAAVERSAGKSPVVVPEADRASTPLQDKQSRSHRRCTVNRNGLPDLTSEPPAATESAIDPPLGRGSSVGYRKRDTLDVNFAINTDDDRFRTGRLSDIDKARPLKNRSATRGNSTQSRTLSKFQPHRSGTAESTAENNITPSVTEERRRRSEILGPLMVDWQDRMREAKQIKKLIEIESERLTDIKRDIAAAPMFRNARHEQIDQEWRKLSEKKGEIRRLQEESNQDFRDCGLA